MPLCPLSDFVSLKTKRLMGLDVGDRTIGLAITDPGWTIASPLSVVMRDKGFKPAALKILKEMDEFQVAGLVVGLPLNMNGTEGPQAQKTRQFIHNFLNQRDLPIAFFDERLSTAAMMRALIDADVSRQRQDKAIDKMAASFILKGAIDYLKNNFFI